MTKDYTDYLGTLPLVEALWWFIENVPEEDEHRTDYFFTLRERVRDVTPYQYTKPFYAVTGRIPGDDEDMCLTFQCDSKEEACKEFEETMYVLHAARNEVEALKEGVWRIHGVGIFINCVVTSASPIHEV